MPNTQRKDALLNLQKLPNRKETTKSRLSEFNRKSTIKGKKTRIRSPNKRSKIKVNLPKEKNSNMMIEEAFNCSVIDENTLAERLQISGDNKYWSRSQLTSNKHQDIVNTMSPDPIKSKELYLYYV